ncbi:MAG: hypothetical protein D6719_06730 [Candidatus Dadabacteria bacterium]|nr:MAG: hypothetical protein D6719_06730 [Candidatus Dadabacteria bacterium]
MNHDKAPEQVKPEDLRRFVLEENSEALLRVALSQGLPWSKRSDAAHHLVALVDTPRENEAITGLEYIRDKDPEKDAREDSAVFLEMIRFYSGRSGNPDFLLKALKGDALPAESFGAESGSVPDSMEYRTAAAMLLEFKHAAGPRAEEIKRAVDDFFSRDTQNRALDAKTVFDPTLRTLLKGLRHNKPDES